MTQTGDVRQPRTQRGADCAQRIYDIIARDDFNPDHAADIRQSIEETLAAQPSEVERLRQQIADYEDLIGVIKSTRGKREKEAIDSLVDAKLALQHAPASGWHPIDTLRAAWTYADANDDGMHLFCVVKEILDALPPAPAKEGEA